MLRNVSNFLSTNITTGRVTIPLTVFPLKCSWWDCGGGGDGDDNGGGGGGVDGDDDGVVDDKGNDTDVVIQQLVTSDGSDGTQNDPGHPENEWEWLSRRLGGPQGLK